jgi:hypothetical protein
VLQFAHVSRSASPRCCGGDVSIKRNAHALPLSASHLRVEHRTARRIVRRRQELDASSMDVLREQLDVDKDSSLKRI